MSKLLYSKNLGDYEFLVYSDRPDIELYEVKQIHSDKVIACCDDSKEIESDGLISHSNQTMAIKTADCLPVAYIGDNGTALIHAGWKGVQNKILVSEILNEINPHTILIGPHIGLKSYEVGSEFFDYFEDKYISKINNKLYLNLSDAAIDQLKNQFPSATVEDVNICTFTNQDYNSYRRNKTNIRNWNILKRK